MASPMASPKASPKASAVRRAAIAAATVAKRWPRRVLDGEWCLARKSAPRRARHAVGEEHDEAAQTHGALPSAGQPHRDRQLNLPGECGVRIWGFKHQIPTPNKSIVLWWALGWFAPPILAKMAS